jgi:hypothetical protein
VAQRPRVRTRLVERTWIKDSAFSPTSRGLEKEEMSQQ